MTRNKFDFWTSYDDLCNLLILANKKSIAGDLKKAQLPLNGLTDGWYLFLEGFEKAIRENETFLDERERNIADDLLSKLRKSLSDR